MCCGQGKAHQELFGGAISNHEQCWWPAGRAGVALLGTDLVELLAGEARADLVAAVHHADVQGHSRQRTRRSASPLSAAQAEQRWPGGKCRGLDSRGSKVSEEKNNLVCKILLPLSSVASAGPVGQGAPAMREGCFLLCFAQRKASSCGLQGGCPR